MTTVERDRCDAAAAELIASAPPLNAETRAKLRSLLAPVTVVPDHQRTAGQTAPARAP